MLKYFVLVPVICLLLFGSVACQAKSGTSNVSGGVIQVVAAENFWGSIASQVGGSHVNVISIINDPNVDPHSYEPTSQDAKDRCGRTVRY